MDSAIRKRGYWSPKSLRTTGLDQGFQNVLGRDPQNNIFEVRTPLYLLDSIPQANVVKIADPNFRSAIFTLSCLIFDSLASLALKRFESP